MALAFTPGDDVIDPLLIALKDETRRCARKRRSAWPSGATRASSNRCSPPSADEDAQVREKAAIALGASGDSRAVAALQKAASDPDSQVREKAVPGLLLFGLRQ